MNTYLRCNITCKTFTIRKSNRKFAVRNNIFFNFCLVCYSVWLHMYSELFKMLHYSLLCLVTVKFWYVGKFISFILVQLFWCSFSFCEYIANVIQKHVNVFLDIPLHPRFHGVCDYTMLLTVLNAKFFILYSYCTLKRI
jgi:hypothetical protein